jgi:hypothetical protein
MPSSAQTTILTTGDAPTPIHSSVMVAHPACPRPRHLRWRRLPRQLRLVQHPDVVACSPTEGHAAAQRFPPLALFSIRGRSSPGACSPPASACA